ncbi:HEAT repeat domain-containing protein [Thermoanaerobacter wiegelii]|uniref:PBS lyase HEAT domain protein repeat-containing protein n=1 Tax=Thermoanaerobacter wiegelii Rt8.B1 TaxID=697303 RepID=G2MXX9_9THEO|nr:HEAT repeat domain-containing protein [Thermoanaerobacter wiegelii]AEM79727.1 PBS lyase HEAT domain protein repeat-containing protein [Thermoanaerobacter wiegelii Rt8.B1]
MELLVLYSIIAFSIIIFFLYGYLVFEKIYAEIKEKIKQRYLNEVSFYLDSLVSRFDEEELDETHIEQLRMFMKHKIKREIVEERIIYYFENFKGELAQKLTTLCDDIGLIEYEIEKLKHKDLHEVALACRNLGEFRSRKAVKPLLNLIGNESTDVKYNVLLALSKIGDEEAFIEAFKKLSKTIPLSERSLIEIADSFEGDKLYVYKSLMHLDDDFISSVFIKSAGNYRDTSLANDIALFLNSDSKEKKIAALKALGNMGDNRYVDAITELLNDKDWEVRAVAAKVLGQMQDDRALLPLVKALSDRQWYVRYNAAHSLINIEGGLDMISLVLQGEDKFAKDIIISVLETIYGWDKLLEGEANLDQGTKLSNMVKQYIENR